ncbi:MAG: DNA-formamidopyrimidine glycosylase family protein [Candidatus Eisenbacteria bacterium]|nr:DNA-formamidopyrimidine glycosylase family protein [Candidatus Eisenbacteria bacterium]
MPEGDTIHRVAATLQRVLSGKVITSARTLVPGLDAESLVGHAVDAVEALGKHLIIRFDDGRALRTHMRMTGSWHVYRPGEEWGKPERLARLVLEVDGWVLPCFNAPEIELLTRGAGRSERLTALGPDIVAETFDETAAIERLRDRGDMPVGEALLAQRIISGIGNIYKSETLFLCGISPFRLVRDLPDDTLRDLVQTARRLMRSNLETSTRTTRQSLDGARYWVYRRSGAPCRRCGTLVEMRRQGLGGRSSYWCPGCQG